MSERPVFVSSKMEELAPERKAVRAALEEIPVGAWLFEEDAGARSGSIQSTYLEEVAAAKIYVGIFWKGYGAYTIEEYEHAQRLGKDCLIYEKRTDIEGRDPELQQFLDDISTVEAGHTIQWFNSADDLAIAIKKDLVRLFLSKFKEEYSVWNVPLPRNLHFTGREEVLGTLHSNLDSGKETALTQAIAGLGGIGKTQLALEYVYRYRKNYNIVWWIRAEEPAVLAADFAALATKLGIGLQQDQDLVVEDVKNHLMNTSDWLLVFDNVTEENEVRPYLLPGSAGNIIITSRSTHWDTISELEMQTWSREESADFLIKRTGQEGRAGALNVADLLGDLPLALEQAGAYMKKKGRSFADYADLFERKRQELWVREDSPAAYHEDMTVSTTWNMAMEEVEKKAPAGVKILNLCAFLAPDNILRSFLDSASEEIGDAFEVDDGIAALGVYSLISVGENTISVHRLVQGVVRDKLTEEAPYWVELALKVIESAWLKGDMRQWDLIKKIIPHEYAALNELRRLEIVGINAASRMIKMGHYLKSQAKYKDAELLYRSALEVRERVLGSSHFETLLVVNNLGALLAKRGDLDGGEQLIRQALEGLELLLGTEHSATLLTMSNLGSILCERGNLNSAELLCRRVLEVQERMLGPDHPETLFSVNNLGSLLRIKGDFERAESLLMRSVGGLEHVLGPDHPVTLCSVQILGFLQLDIGNIEGAELLYRRVLEGQKRVLGPDHSDTLRSVCNLGILLEAKGDLDSSELMHRQALEVYERALGTDHRETLVSVNNLGSLLQRKGDFDSAELLYRQALAGREQLLGSDHPETLVSVNNLGSLLLQKGDFDSAELLIRQAFAGRERLLGSDHPDTLVSVSSLGFLLLAKGDIGGAEVLFLRVLESEEGVFGLDHFRTLRSAYNLGSLLQQKGDFNSAELLLSRSAEGLERVLGPDHLETLRSVHNLGYLLFKMRDLNGAELLISRVLEGRERLLGFDHPETLASASNLGVLLQAKGDLDSAELLFRRVLESQERVFGTDHPETLKSLFSLGSLLYSRGDFEDGELFLRQTVEGSERVFGSDHPDTVIFEDMLNSCLSEINDNKATRWKRLFRRWF